MANEQNLKPSQYKFTDEDRRKATRARQEKLKRRKTFAEAFEAFLITEHTDKNGVTKTGLDVLSEAVLKKAVKGDLKAFELVRDTVGEKPVDKIAKIEISQEVRDEVDALVEKYEKRDGDPNT